MTDFKAAFNEKYFQCHAHGRLLEPPSRASMWRMGFDAPQNFDDDQTYCGWAKLQWTVTNLFWQSIWCACSSGWGVQWNDYGGRCGICGDAWGDFPREHEAPLGWLLFMNCTFMIFSKSGKFATGTLVRHYTSGSWVPVIVDITTNHGGYFAFKVIQWRYGLTSSLLIF